MSGIVYRNLLLAHLGEEDLRLLEPFEPIDVDLRFSIEKAGKPITHVYFPESAVASVVLQAGSSGLAVEMGVTGLDGMTGLPLLYGDDRSAMETFIQIPGRMSRITPNGLSPRSRAASSSRLFSCATRVPSMTRSPAPLRPMPRATSSIGWHAGY